MNWGTDIEIERRNRILVALWAYAYEVMGESLVSDSTFDEMCLKIRPEMSTGNEACDKFFRKEFSPHTGMWIHKHPEPEEVRQLYSRWTGKIGLRIRTRK